jgi:hypothetical protein
LLSFGEEMDFGDHAEVDISLSDGLEPDLVQALYMSACVIEESGFNLLPRLSSSLNAELVSCAL